MSETQSPSGYAKTVLCPSAEKLAESVANAIEHYQLTNMNKPFVRDNAIFIPTNDNAYILSEYRDETVLVAGDDLTAEWGYQYYGGDYRHRATDNPEADLATVLAVYERNTAPKPRVPYVRGMNLYIPADKNGILPDYQDPSVKVVGMTLDPNWGYRSINRKFRCLYTRNHEAALAKVMEVYERNTAPKPKVPYVKDGLLHIPADENGLIHLEYLSDEYVIGERLADFWGSLQPKTQTRARRTYNPEQDLAKVMEVYERNTAPKPRVPHTEGLLILIPAGSDGCILPEYVDENLVVAGESLDAHWGYVYAGFNRGFHRRHSSNPEADLAKVMEVYERNTNKDVVITITKLPPNPHPESGAEIPVPKCRVELGVSIPRAEDFTRDRAVPFLVLFCEDVTPKRWSPNTVRRQVFAADTMSAALALAEAKAKDIRITVRDYLARVAAYDEKRAAAIAAADAEYKRRANA